MVPTPITYGNFNRCRVVPAHSSVTTIAGSMTTSAGAGLAGPGGMSRGRLAIPAATAHRGSRSLRSGRTGGAGRSGADRESGGVVVISIGISPSPPPGRLVQHRDRVQPGHRAHQLVPGQDRQCLVDAAVVELRHHGGLVLAVAVAQGGPAPWVGARPTGGGELLDERPGTVACGVQAPFRS